MANQGDRFRRRALSRGYKVDEVDAFLDRVEATLSGEPMGTPVPSQEVDDVVFRVRFGGYDEWQVDVYLDRVARQLGELEERGVLGRAPAPEYASGPIGESPQRDSMSDEYEAMPRETAMMTRQEPSPPRDREMGFPPREPSPPRDREMGFPPREPSPPRDREMGFPPREPMRPDADSTMMMPQPSPPRGREPSIHDEPSTPPPSAPQPPPPAGPGRSQVEDDGESFAHLRPDDSEGFAHLRGDDDYDDPFAGYSPKTGAIAFNPDGGDDFASRGRPAHMDEPPTERFGPPPADRGFGPPPDGQMRGPHPDDEFAPSGRPGGMMPPPPPPPPVSDQWGGGPEVGHPGGYGGGFEDEMTRPVRRQVSEPDAESELAPRLRRGGNDERFTPPPMNRRMEQSPPNESQMMDSHVSPSTPPGGLRNDADAPTMAHPVVSQPPASPPGRPPSPYDDPQGYRDFGRPPAGPPQGDAPVDYGRRNPYEGRGMFDEPGQHGREEMTTEMRPGDSPFGPQDLQRVEQLRGSFQPRRFGSGYDPSQVNRMFDAMSANMTSGSPVPVSDKELDTSQFSLVQQGYFEAEVDAALREVRDIFAKRGMVR